MTKIEQLNIGGKRSGDGFVAHKAMLTDALSRAVSDRVILLDFTVGRKGLLGYLKALAGNVVKVTPANGIASETQDMRISVKSATGFAPNRPPSRSKSATPWGVGGAAPSLSQFSSS